MRILLIHNYYGDKSQIGGEAMVVRNEAELLRRHGHEVLLYERENREFMMLSWWKRLARLPQLGWSRIAAKEIAAVLDDFKPEIMHVHNYKFMLTPSIFVPAAERGIRTVLTLHNYRLMVPCGNYMDRQSRICERCADGRYSRYWLSRCTGVDLPHCLMQYAAFRGGLRGNRLSRWVDCYITLTDFAREKLLKLGVPAAKISVKSNFIADAPENQAAAEAPNRHGALFVGRLSEEKGVAFLLEAWRDIAYPLTIIGDGPLRTQLQQRFNREDIHWLGSLDNAEVQKHFRQSAFMVFPSTCYEGQPLSVLEAKATGTPVIAADVPPRREMITDGRDGFLYQYGSLASLQEKIRMMIDLPAATRQSMCRSARQSYLEHHSPEPNYRRLMEIYGK